MKFVIHDYITKEVSAIYDTETKQIQTFGNFEVLAYGKGAEPVFDLFEDGTALLVKESFVMFPEYLD